MNNPIDAEEKKRQINGPSNKKNRNNQYDNMFSDLIEVLTGDKSDLDKVKALIILEQDYLIAKDKTKLLSLFKLFSECFNQSEFVCSALFKGQILMTSTTLLILLDVKNENPVLFHSFIDNVLIEHLKNTSNQANLYLRQITCFCLEEFEIEYPGMMFGLMGQRTLEIIETGKMLSGSNIEDIKSVRSCMPFGKRFAGSVRESTFKNLEYKKIELTNDGLYLLIEEERFYVFQYYLMLYTRILNHVIMLYIEQGRYSSMVQNQNSKSIKVQKTDELKDFKGKDDTKAFGVNDSYMKRPELGNSNINCQLMSLSKDSNDKLYPFARLNQQNLNLTMEQNTVLHISDYDYQSYIDLYEKIITSNSTYSTDKSSKLSMSTSIHSDLFSYINKSLSHVIHLLPKTSEFIKVKIWQMISYIISNIEINQIALLPHFNYFHLNNSSQLLTLVIIPIIANFESTLKSNFILKLVIKLCLLINDIRLNKALRILSIRWLLSFRSSFAFNFDHYLKTISYYLSPTPFDSIDLRNEKIKSLFIFFQQNNTTGSEFIINSLSIFDNYVYFPIFSKHIKTLFKTYLFLVIRFPYPNVIKLLGIRIKNNLKEVPRLLPNAINLLRNIKALTNVIRPKEHQMSSEEIYRSLLIDMAEFIANYNSHTRLNSYFELFIELSKEKSIEPSNLIKALRNLYSSIKDLRNWKTEKNILEVCKYLLEYHDLDIMKKNNIQTLLNDIKTKSFDYGIREQARLYYELVANVEKPILNKFIKSQTNSLHQEIDVTYDYCDYDESIINLLSLEQSKDERLEANLNDRGTAIYNCGCNPNMLFISDYKQNNLQENILLQTFNDQDVCFKKLNDYSKNQINDLVDNFICPSDILRLFIPNETIDISKDALIPENEVFFTDNTNDAILTVNNCGKDCNEKEALLRIEEIQANYYKMISETSFYIKLPLNISLQDSDKTAINKMYSISLCFGSVSHLKIKSKIILPYLERTTGENIHSFPYFYKTYLIIYPNYPIPSEIKARAIFYDEKGRCCTGLLKTVKIAFEDYFLPITIPQVYQGKDNEFKSILFKTLWKTFKTSTALHVNTNRLVEFPKEIMIQEVNRKLFPFLIDPQYESRLFIMKNPYTNTVKDDEQNSIIKLNYSEESGEFTKISYDFIMDNFLEMNYDKTALHKTNKLDNGKYILAKALIFLPDHYHILFKIKISDFSSIIEIRNDCKEIIEYIDDYFDSWEANN